MRASVAVVLCLCGLALAAEDKSDRKSRQILHPLVHSSHSIFGHQPYHFPAVPYVQPAVHSVALPQHYPAFHLSGPQVFSGPHYPTHYHSPRYHYVPQHHHYPQIAFPFAGRYQQQPTPIGVNNERFQSPRPFQQSGESSFRPSNTPSQEYNERQNLQSAGSQNPNSRQSQTSSEQTGLSAFSGSPRFQDQPQPNMPLPSDAANSQPSSQQTRAFFSGAFDQQNSSPAQGSQQGAPTPILSQSGQIRNDGSYNFGFQSANGIQRTETSEMRPGLYR